MSANSTAAEYIHQRQQVGDLVFLRPGGNVHWDPVTDPALSLMLAGGIGITPVLAVLQHAQRRQVPATLVWTVRSLDLLALPLMDLGVDLAGSVVHLTGDADQEAHASGARTAATLKRGRPDVRAYLADAASGAFVFACGPQGLQDEVAQAAENRTRPQVLKSPAKAHGRITRLFRPPMAKPNRMLMKLRRAWTGTRWRAMLRRGRDRKWTSRFETRPIHPIQADSS